MPYDVPVENAIGVAQAVYETDSVREMLKNYVAEDEDIEVELPDYEHLEKPLVEVFTLDSATCAACTYMMGAANEVKKTFGDAIDMVEYKFTLKENIARCKKMGVPKSLQKCPSQFLSVSTFYFEILSNVSAAPSSSVSSTVTPSSSAAFVLI